MYKRQITVLVEKIAPDGEGLALYDGNRIFIPLSAPGDLIKANIIEEHGFWARAAIQEICEFSPQRAAPQCPYYGECGGCSLQHLSYQAQLDVKKAILAETLTQTKKPGTEAPHEPSPEFPSITVIPSEPWEYRNRVSLHALRSNRFPRCGFKARKDAAVIPLEDCPAAVSGIRKVLHRLLPPPGKDRFTIYSKDALLIAETGTSIADDKTGNGFKQTISGRGTITLSGREITLEAASFFQSNAGALENLVCRLREAAEKAVSGSKNTAHMADLYAGVGTLSVFIADLFPGGIDVVEADSNALNLAKSNLSRLQQTDSERYTQSGGKNRFFPQKMEQWVKKRNLGSYDFIVADPPRQGLSPILIQSLCRSGPPVFVYVSCEAQTFARDFHMLKQNYKPEGLILYDFYPQTAHIETMGIFIRK